MLFNSTVYQIGGGDYKLLYGTITLPSTLSTPITIPYEGKLVYAQIDFVTTSQGESIGKIGRAHV